MKMQKLKKRKINEYSLIVETQSEWYAKQTTTTQIKQRGLIIDSLKCRKTDDGRHILCTAKVHPKRFLKKS